MKQSLQVSTILQVFPNALIEAHGPPAQLSLGASSPWFGSQSHEVDLVTGHNRQAVCQSCKRFPGCRAERATQTGTVGGT